MFTRISLIITFLLTLTTFSFASSLVDISTSSFKLAEDGNPVCSGTFVSDTDYVTAAHCVPNKTAKYEIVEEIRGEDGGVIQVIMHRVKTVRVDAPNDVALLRITDNTLNHTFVDVENAQYVKDNLVFGVPLISVGFPEVQDMVASEGRFGQKTYIYMGKADNGFFASYYKTTVPVAEGASGGGLYIEDNGSWKMVGVASAITNDISRPGVVINYLSFFSTNETLHKILRN